MEDVQVILVLLTGKSDNIVALLKRLFLWRELMVGYCRSVQNQAIRRRNTPIFPHNRDRISNALKPRTNPDFSAYHTTCAEFFFVNDIRENAKDKNLYTWNFCQIK